MPHHLTDDSRRHLRIAITSLVLLFLCIVVLGYWSILRNGDHYDDAYITYRYAINLASGKGLVFNTYEKINSASSLLYTLMLSGMYKIGFQNLEKAAIVIGIISGIAVIVFSLLVAGRLTKRKWVPVLIFLPFCMSGSLSAWAVSGMETTFYMALVVLLFYFYATGRLVACLAVTILCLLTRPEGVILWIAVCMAELTGGKFNAGRFWAMLLVGGFTFGGWLGWNQIYYGSALPHPVLLKKFARYYSHGWGDSLLSTGGFLVNNFSTVAVPGVLMAALVAIDRLASGIFKHSQFSFLPKDRLHAAMAFYILGSILSFVIGPSSDFHRYMVHLMPVLGFAGVAGVDLLLDRTAGIGKRTIAYAGLLVILIGCYQSIMEQIDMTNYFKRAVGHQEARKVLGAYIENNVPQDQLILSSDIGAIAFMAIQRDFVDAFGLTTLAPIRAVQQNDWQSFIQRLRAQQPLWVADTGTADGKISAIEIIGHPGVSFRGIDSPITPLIDMYSPRNHTVLEIPMEDGLVFRLIKLDRDVYKEVNAAR